MNKCGYHIGDQDAISESDEVLGDFDQIRLGLEENKNGEIVEKEDSKNLEV